MHWNGKNGGITLLLKRSINSNANKLRKVQQTYTQFISLFREIMENLRICQGNQTVEVH